VGCVPQPFEVIFSKLWFIDTVPIILTTFGVGSQNPSTHPWHTPSRYAASGITASFPAGDTPIIAAILAQNCQSAGQLLAAPNTAAIAVSQFNTVKNATHQPILDELKGGLIQQCSSSQASPLVITDSNLPNGRIAAYTIDYNRLFVAPDGRAVKLLVGAILVLS